jgi:hypothetical protein
MVRTSRITGAHRVGCSKRPSGKAAASEEAKAYASYVELLREARTPLADFFSILRVAYVGRVVDTRNVGRTYVVMSGNRR